MSSMGENAITGWDYSRALSLMGYYYLAGYYSEQEALDKSRRSLDDTAAV